jgi:hypothetical protein
MAWRQTRTAATALIARLPPLPDPWSVDELCSGLAEQRGRELVLHPCDEPALPFGLWFDDGSRDHIVYRVGVVGYHRDHVVLHEICHMLAGHGHQRDAEEELAEMFASMVLKLSRHRLPTQVSEYERRASALFGAG